MVLPSPQDDSPYTLDELAARLGKPAPTVLDALLPHAQNDALIRLGAKIRSHRIVVDAGRLYAIAYAFWLKATDEQKDELRGFSERLLAVAVDRAMALRDLDADTSIGVHADKARADDRQRAAALTFTRGLAKKDQAIAVLRGVVGQDPVLRARLDEATGGASSDGEALAQVIERTAAFARELLHHQNDAVAVRAELGRLDATYCRSLDTLAADLRRSARDATARSVARHVSQADLDLLDGINLSLLGDIIHAFEAAHDLDPTIPRLVPISTRRLIVSHRTTKHATTTAPAAAAAGDEPA